MRNFAKFLQRKLLLKFLLISFLLAWTTDGSTAELLPPGYRPLPLGVHALTGGRVVIRPGEILDPGTIIIRDGLITEVGKDAAVPADARVWDMKGTTVYAGFIDPYFMPEPANRPWGER